MPYEEIDEKTYDKEVSKLGKLTFGSIKHEEADVDKFCNNDSCEIVPMTGDNDDQDYGELNLTKERQTTTRVEKCVIS